MASDSKKSLKSRTTPCWSNITGQEPRRHRGRGCIIETPRQTLLKNRWQDSACVCVRCLCQLTTYSQDPFISNPTFFSEFPKVPLLIHSNNSVTFTDGPQGNGGHRSYYTTVRDCERLVRKLSILLPCFLNTFTWAFFPCFFPK